MSLTPRPILTIPHGVASGPVTLAREAWLTVTLCFAVMVVEGFDIQAMGVAAPSLGPELKLSREVLGQALSASNIGLVIGAIVGGWLADVFGRKPVLIGLVITFGVFTLMTMQAASFDLLFAARLMTGLGFGGALPNVMAIAADVAPREPAWIDRRDDVLRHAGGRFDRRPPELAWLSRGMAAAVPDRRADPAGAGADPHRLHEGSAGASAPPGDARGGRAVAGGGAICLDLLAVAGSGWQPCRRGLGWRRRGAVAGRRAGAAGCVSDRPSRAAVWRRDGPCRRWRCG